MTVVFVAVEHAIPGVVGRVRPLLHLRSWNLHKRRSLVVLRDATFPLLTESKMNHKINATHTKKKKHNSCGCPRFFTHFELRLHGYQHVDQRQTQLQTVHVERVAWAPRESVVSCRVEVRAGRGGEGRGGDRGSDTTRQATASSVQHA